MENKTEHRVEALSLDQQWLTEIDTARRLGMSRKWLQKARLTGHGPLFAKFGSAVRYSLRDIEEFERASLRHSTSDEGGA